MASIFVLAVLMTYDAVHKVWTGEKILSRRAPCVVAIGNRFSADKEIIMCAINRGQRISRSATDYTVAVFAGASQWCFGSYEPGAPFSHTFAEFEVTQRDLVWRTIMHNSDLTHV